MHYSFPADEFRRDALRALPEDEDLAAVQDAIFEWHRGDKGTPLAVAFDEIRRSNELKSPS